MESFIEDIGEADRHFQSAMQVLADVLKKKMEDEKAKNEKINRLCEELKMEKQSLKIGLCLIALFFYMIGYFLGRLLTSK